MKRPSRFVCFVSRQAQKHSTRERRFLIPRPPNILFRRSSSHFLTKQVSNLQEPKQTPRATSVQVSTSLSLSLPTMNTTTIYMNHPVWRHSTILLPSLPTVSTTLPRKNYDDSTPTPRLSSAFSKLIDFLDEHHWQHYSYAK